MKRMLAAALLLVAVGCGSQKAELTPLEEYALAIQVSDRCHDLKTKVDQMFDSPTDDDKKFIANVHFSAARANILTDRAIARLNKSLGLKEGENIIDGQRIVMPPRYVIQD